MSDEKVDVKKFAEGFTQPVAWWKALSIGMKIAIVLLVGFMIYQTFLKKPTQQIIAKKGSNVQVTQINKPSRFFIPFIEVGIAQRSNSELSTEIRAGVRIEF